VEKGEFAAYREQVAAARGTRGAPGRLR